MELFAIVFLIIVCAYPYILLLRLLRLSCKALKLYIKNAKHEQKSLDAADYQCDSLDDDSSLC